MILRVLLFTLILSLAAPPAMADWWLFNSKKKEAPADEPSQPSLFNSPDAQQAGTPKKWMLDKIFNQQESQPSPDVVVNGVPIKGLKPEMMMAGYAPKSVEEMKTIMFARNAWQDEAMDKMEAEAQERIAAANKKSAEGLQALAEGKYKAPEPQAETPESTTEPETAPVQKIFNTPVISEPGKVFKNYR